MEQKSNFQEDFFQYSLPQAFISMYDEEFIRSNDLRLIIEIATKSYLRMYTDSRTSCIHFTCKKKGSICYDLQAFPNPSNSSEYYFDENLLKKRHQSNDCHKTNQHFRYLQIYNLFKLKKNLIEKFMHENNLMKQSPSNILNKLSGNQQDYFFEKYINKNIEYKRKLRKRFDNTINIDIKKIMKNQHHEVQDGEEDKKKEETHKQLKKQTKNDKSNLKKESIKQKTLKLAKDEVEDEFEHSSQRQSKEEQYQIKHRSFKIKKKIKKQSKNTLNIICKTKQKKNKSQKQKSPANMNNNQDELQLVQPSSQDLSEIKVLNERAQYLECYSSSSSSDQSIKQEDSQEKKGLFDGLQDYFKSLRNSTLKSSLQKQSLKPLLFTYEIGLNKQNINEIK